MSKDKQIIEDNTQSLLLDNILDSLSSAVFLINKKRDVLKYNKAFIDMFDMNYTLNTNKCFNAINISSKVSGVEYFKLRFKKEDEDAESKKCVLNMAVARAINENISTENQIVEDDYYINGQLKQLFLKFSVKPFKIEGTVYVLVSIDDISEFETAKFDLLKNNMKIKRYNNMYKKELKMAKRVQRSILPKKLFVNEDIKIDFRYFPLGEIGGDFFDFFKIDDDHIGVLLCDVAGHGVPSALITTMIKALLESSKALYLSPKRLMKYINNQIIKILGYCFLTMIYGVINTESKEFTYVRAGHPKPWLLSENAVSTMGIKGNLVLGVDEKIKFEEETVSIDKGSKLILFTDGLIDIGRKNCGYEKEIMNLLKRNSDLNSTDLLTIIEENVKERLRDESHLDDICVMIVESL